MIQAKSRWPRRGSHESQCHPEHAQSLKAWREEEAVEVKCEASRNEFIRLREMRWLDKFKVNQRGLRENLKQDIHAQE